MRPPKKARSIRTIYKPKIYFEPGDWVRKFMGQQVVSPFAGKVTNVYAPEGQVDVEWPFGNKRESAELLIRINKANSVDVPTVTGDSSYSSYDNPKLSSFWDE